MNKCFEDMGSYINLHPVLEEKNPQNCIEREFQNQDKIEMKRQFMTFKNLLSPILFLSFLMVFGTVKADEEAIEKGKSLFQANCAACHAVNNKLIGPKLAGVSEKYEDDREWLYAWVKNSKALIDAGDSKANALYNEYNKQQMQAFPNIGGEEVEAILEWVEFEAAGGGKEQANVVGGGDAQDPFANPGLYYALLGLVLLLVVITFVLAVITATLVSAVRTKETGNPLTLDDVWQRTLGIMRNKFVITALTSLILVVGSYKLIVAARGVSLHQGYMPEQPIKFSHKIHAGQYGIECEYCHSGVRKSKNAWIPSVNVCMNCHKGIQQGPTYGTEEIGKILAAYDKNEPIEWVRIHNLPDHAYFNHAQHVVVGGLECQTCHGPIEEMEKVYQYSSLSMGWCINCHRETKVKSLGKETDYTVEDMGGLDCQKCHY